MPCGPGTCARRDVRAVTMEISEIDGPLAAQWQRVRGRLRDEFGEAAYRSWLSSLSLADLVEGAIRIEVPTRFLRDWVVAHYADRIRALWSGENKDVSTVEIVVGDRRVEPTPAEAERALAALVEDEERSAARAEAPVRPAAAATVTPMVEPSDEREISAPLDQRFTFENFVVGKPNELAHAAARRVAESAVSGNRAAPFNPLFLYGGVGLGKTHLMHAIAWHIRLHDPSRKVIYLSAEKFMYRFINALRNQSTLEFKNELRSVDVLMIDDLQFLIGKDNTQEEFFHTFNALVDAGKQIVISADKSPSDLSGLEDRLRTRLGCGMVADLHATTYELRISILEAKANRAGVEVPAKVMEFLAHKITSNIRELEGALNRLVAHANLFDRPVTLETAHEVLHDVLRSFDRRVTIQEIQKRVAEHWNIRVAEMSSARRSRNIARPRQVAMYLAKQLTSKSLPDIGRHFGDRDHTTVMHAVSRVTALISTDSAFAEDVELLRRMLES